MFLVCALRATKRRGCVRTRVFANLPSKRVLEDIDRLPTTWDLIIAAEGTYIPELDYRQGHRKAAQRASVGNDPEGSAIDQKLPTDAKLALSQQMATWAGKTKQK